MAVPRLSARTWFWSLTFAAFLWTYVGTRTVATPFMLSAQGIVGYPVQLLATPGSWIMTLAQHAVAATFRAIGSSHYETRTVASLEEENKKLQDELAIKDGQINLLLEQIRSFNVHKDYGIPPANLKEANIVGKNPGAGAGTLNIDKGTADGISPGMPVIAGENHILGRISAAGPKTATVRLTSDPGSKIMAIISRRMEGKTYQITKEPFLVEGNGNGQFSTGDIKTSDVKIEKGDIVQLYDRQWPAKLQYFILGVVTDVGTNPRQMLRYEVRGRANINDLQTVEVLTKY